MTNAATIKAAREATGLSAREAASLVGVTTVTWQRWEGQSSRATEIPYAHWNLFLLLVGAHPVFTLSAREATGLSAREAAGWSDAQLVQNGMMMA